MTDPILKYPGAKWRLADWVQSYTPRCLRVVDAYCGSGAFALNLWYRPEHLVLNDRDQYINRESAHGHRKRLYRHEMTDADHAALLDVLEQHPGPVLLSGYHNALYDARLASWQHMEIKTQAEKGNTRTEVLWLNDQASETRQMRFL